MRFHYTMHWDSEGRWHPIATTIDIEGFRNDDFIAQTIRWQKTFWEIELLEDIATRGPRGGIFVDVGANVGNHTVYFAKFLADHVVAVEANPTLVPVLRRNLEANQLTNASVMTCGVGAEVGFGCLVPAPEGFEKNTGGSHVEVEPSNPHSAGDGFTVPVTTLDCILAELQSEVEGKRVTFVKLDIEGMELEALQGGASLLARERPQLAVEARTAEAYSAVCAFLKEFGYLDIGQFQGTPTHYFIDPNVHRLRASEPTPADLESYRRQMAIQELDSVIPPGEVFSLVDEAQWGVEILGGRSHLHFPERDGQYWGRPPDAVSAIQEFERSRAVGANFIVFTWPAFWWLEYYAEFHHYLRTQFKCVLENDRLVVFDLRT
jgi:FkbM family methyltransferase